MPNQTNEAAPLKVDLGIDYGTSSIKIRYKTYVNGEPLQEGRNMYFSSKIGGTSSCNKLPTEVAWFEEKFHFGLELSERVRLGEVPAESVIQCSKVAVHYRSENISCEEAGSATYTKVMSQLKHAGKTIYELLNAHVKGIIRMAVDHIKADSAIVQNFGRNKVPDPEIFVRLTVPQMWKTNATEMMYRALPADLVQNAVLAREPQCAVAAYFDLSTKLALGLQLKSLKKGDTILINDLGCGTGDAVFYELRSENASNQFRLHAKKESLGALCGSHRVNEHVLESILGKLGAGVDKALMLLDMEKAAFDWHLLKVIEDAKTKPDLSRQPIAVYSDKAHWVCEFAIDRTMIAEAQARVIGDIIKMNSKLLDKEVPSAVLLLGGFSCSPLLQSTFERKYQTHQTLVFTPKNIGDLRAADVELLVAHGALSDRYGEIVPQKLPREYVYAFLQDEKFNYKLHSDCTKGHKKEGQNRKHDPAKTVKNEIKKEGPLAPDRLIKILTETNSEEEEVTEATIPQEYVVNALEPIMQKIFVYLDRNKTFKDHEAAREAPPPEAAPKPAEQWNFRKGVHPWVTVRGNLTPNEFRDVLEGHVESVSGKESVELYKFKANMKVEYRAEREINISWDILDKDNELLCTVLGEQRLWSGTRSVFIQDDVHASEIET